MQTVVKILKKMTNKQIILYSVLAVSFVVSMFFVNHNHSWYERSIAKVVETSVENSSEIVNRFGNEDHLYTQQIIAVLKNGGEKGQFIHLTNEYSDSRAYDHKFRVGNELFVFIDTGKEDDTVLTGNIMDVKRDYYIMLAAWIFIFTLLFVGRKQGFFAVVSLAVNTVLLSFALDVYINTSGISLLVICGIAIVLFTIISLLLVNGFNEKTFSAIIATLLGTFISFFVAYLAMVLTSEKGLQYEDIQFITRHYKTVFLAGLFIGSLGAVMDVAITMSSSIFGLYEKNNNISLKALKASGMEIGKDIMGTMTNILLFAYISGSIPMLLLYLKNGVPLGFTLSMNLSLELARALAGGIGIVLTIPIGLYVSIFFINRKRARG